MSQASSGGLGPDVKVFGCLLREQELSKAKSCLAGLSCNGLGENK